jgi:nicotinate-nucleotide adenylyltransferase
MRLGIIGGSFNPIHLGHLVVAMDVLRRLRLDRVVFVPSFQPPHKAGPLVDFRHRLRMVQLATAAEPLFAVSAVESERSGPSYTVDTLAALRLAYPRTTLFFMMGSDQYRSMRTWHEPERLTRLAQLVVMTRPGIARPRLYPGHACARVRFVAVPQVSISAAVIRDRLAKGESIRYMLPTPVRSYISRHRLYSR